MSTFSHVLKEIGEFGLFQKRLVAILCIPSLFVSFDVIGQVFTGMSFPHHCNTDWILEIGPELPEQRQKNLTIPVRDDGTYESCRMFEPVSWNLGDIEAYGLNATSECINGSVFEAPQGASSIVTAVSVQFFMELQLYPLGCPNCCHGGAGPPTGGEAIRIKVRKSYAKFKVKYAIFLNVYNLHHRFSIN